MSPAGFEPTVSAGERPQTYALDSAATGTEALKFTFFKLKEKCFVKNYGGTSLIGDMFISYDRISN